jgi:hypothetical protein
MHWLQYVMIFSHHLFAARVSNYSLTYFHKLQLCPVCFPLISNHFLVQKVPIIPFFGHFLINRCLFPSNDFEKIIVDESLKLVVRPGLLNLSFKDSWFTYPMV